MERKRRQEEGKKETYAKRKKIWRDEGRKGGRNDELGEREEEEIRAEETQKPRVLARKKVKRERGKTKKWETHAEIQPRDYQPRERHGG